MIKNSIKIILIALTFIILFSIFEQYSFAVDTDKYKVDPYVANNPTFSGMISKVLGIFIIIGIIVAVAGAVIIGIQTMLGSVEERAVYKQKALPFFSGLAILLSITSIIYFIGAIAQGNEKHIRGIELEPKTITVENRGYSHEWWENVENIKPILISEGLKVIVNEVHGESYEVNSDDWTIKSSRFYHPEGNVDVYAVKIEYKEDHRIMTLKVKN